MMNKFTKDNLHRQGQYLVFGPDRKFVARFKHGGPFTMAKFKKELIANHTPESYFREHDSGVAPLTILQNANPAWYNRIMTAFKLARQ
jgi:hypothetical protein